MIPNGFDKKGEKTGYQEKYKTVSRNSGILDDIKFDEGVLDETVAIDIDIKKRDKGDIDRRYYISLLDRFFDLHNSTAEAFYREEMSLEDYLTHLKSNTTQK